METVRELMIEHGASIKIIENICTIRINANYPCKQMIDGVLRDLRAAILSQQYIANTMILR
jgi:hypothetical protein